MPKAFPKSETIAWKVVKDEASLIECEFCQARPFLLESSSPTDAPSPPPRYQTDEQRQRYTLPLIHSPKIIESLVSIQLNPTTGKIVKLEDRWDNKPLPQSGVTKTFREMNGKYFTPTMVSVPKQ